MDLLNELEKYLNVDSINEETTFKPVYLEDDEYEQPASFVVEDDDTGELKATISVYDEDGNPIDAVNDDYNPSDVTVEVVSDDEMETKALVATKLKAMGFVNVVCDGKQMKLDDYIDKIDDDDIDDDDIVATVKDIEGDDSISILDLEDDDDDDY
ncbi:MAG: hypothetical protein ACOCZ5_00120 [bacterium]